jgi:predicted molibdopterin-dependent oxidoreductase YjgC
MVRPDRLLETGTGACPRCGTGCKFQVIDMTGDRSRIDRLWACPGEHRESHVQEEYPEFAWENRRRR